jgi:hypothetical protein
MQIYMEYVHFRPLTGVSEQRQTADVVAHLSSQYDRHLQHQPKFVVAMPTVVRVPSGEEVVVCLNRKVASEQWRYLFLKAGGWDLHAAQDGHFNNLHRQVEAWAGRMHLFEGVDSANGYVDKVVRELRDRSFLFVRNPYARLLSAFLHKVSSARAKGCYTLTDRQFNVCPHPTRDSEAQSYEKSPRAFSVFIRDLHALFKADQIGNVNKHIRPLSLQCGLQHGLHYSHILKVP